ncbi:MAG: potassium/hydrogen antiporter [Frankiales bacterium]|jgi:cell volume regulation protein A|nr:potassium/hydrogen antiporter [Frankiales bacterium]
MDHGVDLAVLAGCGLLLTAVLAVRLSSRTGVPALLVYLGIGLALGEAGLGIRFEDYDLTGEVGLVALAIILAEGGLTTRWAQVREAAGVATVLSTVGVLISVSVVAGATVWLLGTSWRTALLLGAAVASTDAAAVFSVLRRLPLKSRISRLLEAESGLNDAPTVVLVTLVSSDSWASTSALEVAGLVVYELVVGLAVGLAIGWVGRVTLGRLALPSAGLYPLATVGLVLLSFGAAGIARGSGFLAVYVAGLVIGSTRLPHRRAVLGFATSLALLAELGLFVLLGLLASPGRLVDALPTALVVGAAALLVARPLAVLVSTTPFRTPLREQAFLAWAGLRGAVPIVLAIVPVTQHVPGGERVLDVVFVLVVVYTLLQAPTLPYVGRRLGVVEDVAARDLEVEAAPLESVGADLLQVTVRSGSQLHGVYVDELRLPPGAVLSLVVRGREGTVPTSDTRLEHGDQLLIVATTESRTLTEERLRAVSRDGKLARWYGPRL